MENKPENGRKPAEKKNPEKKSPQVGTNVIGYLLALGIAVRLPLLGLLDDLPVLRIVSNGRLRIEYALLMALLAGYGLDALRRDGGAAIVRRVLYLWGGLTLALAAVAAIVLSSARPYGWMLPAATVARVASSAGSRCAASMMAARSVLRGSQPRR